MRQREWIRLAMILIIALTAGWIVLPTNPGIHFSVGDQDVDVDFRSVLGLDLQGGLQVLLEASPPPGVPVTSETMDAARDIIESRVNEFGTTEPVIQIQGSNRIVVEMPGIKTQEDRERAVRVFGETGLLEFMDTGAASPPPGTRVTEGQFPTVLTGKNIDPRKVSVGFDEQTRRPLINFGWDDEGSRVFAEYTEKNVGRYLAIVLDKEVLSAPRINSKIEGSGVITGVFQLEEARDIVTKLKYGALPIPMKVVQQREVGASLGQDSIRRSLVAGVVGLGIIAAFMITYYRLPGVVAVLALLTYALITLAIFKNPWAPITLTLAGIAGFILSIGMAVDANVLIFERMKEELRTGRSVTSAVEAGFTRAWSSIWDSNITTLITCAILYYFGTGIIRGFALTLAVGVAVSLFTSITVTRTFLRFVVTTALARYPALFGARPTSSTDAQALPRSMQPAGA